MHFSVLLDKDGLRFLSLDKISDHEVNHEPLILFYTILKNFKKIIFSRWIHCSYLIVKII